MNTVDMTINGAPYSFPKEYLPINPELADIIMKEAVNIPGVRGETFGFRKRLTVDSETWDEPEEALVEDTLTREARLYQAASFLARKVMVGKVTKSRTVTINGMETYVPTETISLQILATPRMWAHFAALFKMSRGTSSASINGRECPIPEAAGPKEYNKACQKSLFHALTGRSR